MRISPQQIKGAIAMLGLTRGELATRAGISVTALHNILNQGADAKGSTWDALQIALEEAGVEFLQSDDGGPGVRIKRPK